MEHLADELDARRLIGVLLFKLHHQTKGAVLERSVGRSDNDGVPAILAQSVRQSPQISYHVITLSATGEAETPAGGSVCIR